MDTDPVRDSPYLNAIEVPDVMIVRNRYQECLDRHHTLANLLLDGELQHSTVMYGAARKFFERTTELTLECMDTRVVHGILRANLPVVYRTDQTTKKVPEYFM